MQSDEEIDIRLGCGALGTMYIYQIARGDVEEFSGDRQLRRLELSDADLVQV